MQANSDTSSQRGSSALPVTIVGGYLGSGKTTLINHVLKNAAGRRYAVLVNDFGELAIDAQLIESEDGDVINLSGGCVCCSYGNDLTSAMMQLDTTAIDQIIIESSGVALPGAIAGSLSLLPAFKVSSIVVLADCTTVERHSTDRYLADTIHRQLYCADLILINKTDLLDELQQERVSDWLQYNYPAARLVPVSHANYPVGLFLVGHSLNQANRDVTSIDEIHATSIYTTFTVDVTGQYDVSELAVKLAELEPGLLRVKGFARDLNGCMQLIQLVGKRWTLHAAPAGARAGLVCIGLSSDNLSSESVSEAAGLSSVSHG